MTFSSVLSGRTQEPLSLQRAWSIALENNYSIQQQEKMIEKAQHEIAILETDYYPSLSSSAMLARANFDQFPIDVPNASGKVGIDLISLSVNQSIFSGFSTKKRVSSALENLTAQQIEKQVLANSLLLTIGRVYYDIHSNLLQQETLKASINRLDNQLTRVRNLFLSDQATPFDTLEIANRKLQIENQLSLMKDAEQILYSNLEYLLNQEKLPEVKTLSLIEIDYSVKSPEAYFSESRQYRPELQNLQTLKKAQNYIKEAFQARYYPQLSASVSYNFLKPHGDILTTDWTNFYSIMINFQWELWNWKRDAKKVQQAALDIQRLDLQELQLVEDIRQQVEIACQNLQSVRKTISLQKKLLDQEKLRYRITDDRYRQGLATFLDLNSAESALTEAEAALHKSYISWYKNKLQLDFATGKIRYQTEEVSHE
jgi:outer membrane protein TolC